MDYSVFHNLSLDNQSIIILLMLPIVATIVGIARHIIGIKSLGIYAPIVLTFGFYALGLIDGHEDTVTGLKYGLIITTIIFITTFLGTGAIKRWRMHYYPKVSIVITLVAVALGASLIIAAQIGKTQFSSSNVFALVLMASVAEQFTSSLAKNNVKTAMLITAETLVITVFCYLLISWNEFQKLLLTYPYLILLTIVINYIVGRYKGLRIREYFRFRQILNSNSVD